MFSLKERVELLERDLTANPMRISVYRDLPFAILRYDPEEEWAVRREARLLATRLIDSGKEVKLISLADLLWEVIDEAEGMDALVRLERERGFQAAQAQVTTYLSHPDWLPLSDLLEARLRPLDPRRHIAFLMRAAAMAPAIYQMSALLAARGLHSRADRPPPPRRGRPVYATATGRLA